MKNKIEICDNNTNETGTYKVWYSDQKKMKFRLLDENHTNALLDMQQKEKFFMGQSIFYISKYDFETIVLKGEKRKGL